MFARFELYEWFCRTDRDVAEAMLLYLVWVAHGAWYGGSEARQKYRSFVGINARFVVVVVSGGVAATVF